MIETALVGTQPGTQTGALIGPSTARQAGASEVTDPFGATPARPSPGDLQSSLAPVTKGTFRNSLEEFTGPIALEPGTLKLSTQATDSSTKSQLVQPSDLLSGSSNVRAVKDQPFTVSLDQAGAQDGLQADAEPGLPGDSLKNGQAISQLADDLHQGSAVATQFKQAVGQAGLPSAEVRIANPSGVLKPIFSHTPRTPLLGGSVDTSTPKITMTTRAPLTASDAAGLTPTAQPTTATPIVTSTQSPVATGGEPAVAVQPQSIPTAVIAATQPDQPAATLPIAGLEISSLKTSPVVSKSGTAKSDDAKNNRLAGKSVADPSLTPVQQALTPGVAAITPQAITVTAANDRTPEAGPVAGTPAQTVHRGYTAASAPVHPLSSTTIGAGGQPFEVSTASLEEPGAARQTSNASDAPATFAQVLDLQAQSVPVTQRSSSVGTVAAKAVEASTPPPSTTVVQTPAPDKPGADKSSQFSDQFQTGDAAAIAPTAATHTTSSAQVTEPSLTVTATVPHISSASSLLQPGTTAAAVPSSAHPLAASLNDSSAASSYTSAGDGSGVAQHTTLLSTPNVLEVGVASGSHGWLKVRAELDGSGGVSASVIANSPAAAVTMHKDLPALSAYLSSESVGVSSLVVNQAGASSQTLAGGTAHDITMNFGAGTGGGGPARDQSHLPQPSGAVVTEGRSSEGIESIPSRMDAPLLPSLHAGPGEGFEAGSWLSVRA